MKFKQFSIAIIKEIVFFLSLNGLFRGFFGQIQR